MGSRAAAGGRSRGDGTIPTARAEAAHLVAGAGALALALAVAVRVAVSPASTEAFFGLAAGVGATVVAGAVAAGRPGLVHWGVGLVGGCYVASAVVAGDASDAWSPAVAVALLVCSELATWSIDSRRRGRDDMAVHAIRFRAVVLIAVCGGVLALLTDEAGISGIGGIVGPALAVGALLAALAGLGALMVGFRARP